MTRTAKLAALTYSALLAACTSLYPEGQTPINEYAVGVQPTPPPPPEVIRPAFAGAYIPPKTRDGRAWGETPPDPYARLLTMDGALILETPVQENTREPTWPEQDRPNVYVPLDTKLKVELWASRFFNDHPVCIESVQDIHSGLDRTRPLVITCDSGARVFLAVLPPTAKRGVGLQYEARADALVVTDVAAHSPASRARIGAGDRIVRISGKPVSQLTPEQALSHMNAISAKPVKLEIVADSKKRTVELSEGPIYLLASERASFDND